MAAQMAAQWGTVGPLRAAQTVDVAGLHSRRRPVVRMRVWWRRVAPVRVAVGARLVGVARVLALVLGRVAGRPMMLVAWRGVGVGRRARVMLRRVRAVRRRRGVMRRCAASVAAASVAATSVAAAAEGWRVHEDLSVYAVSTQCESSTIWCVTQCAARCTMPRTTSCAFARAPSATLV